MIRVTWAMCSGSHHGRWRRT